ncbi:hypothetical protein [Corallococcus sp. CA053C]|uniref:hypothetical protein n=1 Tax=Corallococcus sp. CA053C TaxID=2316732 RepID=UPI001315894C|nr:hypothetical protein [Corallococcus sp. CA053C]
MAPQCIPGVTRAGRVDAIVLGAPAGGVVDFVLPLEQMPAHMKAWGGLDAV